MIKLVASDIDGTLIQDSTNELYPEMITMIKEMTKKGILFVAASGRPYESLRYLFDEVKDNIIFLSDNGAFIYYKGELLFAKAMKKEHAFNIIEECRQYKEECHLMVSTKETILIETKDEAFCDLMKFGYHNKCELVEDILLTDADIMKVSLYHKDTIRELGETKILPHWKDKVKACMAGEEWIDFMDETVDKGEALRFLQEYFQIDKEETAAFGDNSNDVGLVMQAGESYAVENAVKEVKENAKYSCPHYSQKGVYQILKKIIL